MKQNKKFIKKLVFLIIAGMSTLSPARIAIAADNDYALSAVEWMVNLGDLNPGETKTGSYLIKNAGEKSIAYEAEAKSYSFNEEGTDVVLDKESTYSQMAKWLTFSNPTGTVEPGQEHRIYFSVSVPNDVPAGTQIIALHTKALPLAEDNGSDVSVQALIAVAPILRADINGETRSEGVVSNNNIPIFQFKAPLSASAMVKNTGNTAFNATYFLQVFPLFSDEEVYTNEEKPEAALVFPESNHFVTQSWKGSPQLGIFRVRQTVRVYEKDFAVERIVFICPMWFLLLFILFVLFCIYWIAGRSRARKKATKRK